jgi:squalene-hopene/tetraprenyl-beta-curcumene cyclase
VINMASLGKGGRVAILVAAFAALAGFSHESPVDRSLSRAAGYLASKQSPDGAWRSETYGAFRDGLTLTPYVMSSIFFLEQGEKKSFHRGLDYLLTWVDEDGQLTMAARELKFPVLNATSASRMIGLGARKDPALRKVQAELLNVVRRRQLTEELGWSVDDPAYGGWGFSIDRPRKPGPDELRDRFFESNLVATVFGIAALRSARVPRTDPAWEKALTFVKRCQNFGDGPFDDGGFYFIPDEPLQNKAGIAGKEDGRIRFRSYGSMTADGLRALLQCGLSKDHPRVVAALKWLKREFSATRNPGDFESSREIQRRGTYYYWAWAVAHAFMRTGVREFESDGKTIRWAEELARELMARQRPDGSWVNRFTDAKEDDPLISTPWAASALAICRLMLAEDGPKGCGAKRGS